MIIYNFHLDGVFPFPAEAKPPLVLYPDAVLAFPLSPQGLQPVARWGTQVQKPPGLIQQQQLSSRHPLDRRWEPSRGFIQKQALSFTARETANHVFNYNAMRYSSQEAKAASLAPGRIALRTPRLSEA